VQKVIWIAVAGAIGAVARFGLSGLVHRIYAGEFPLGTLIVNILGCFLFGLFWSWAEERLSVSGEMRLIVLVGFMGAFTTFSSFAFETGKLIQDAQWNYAIANLAIQNLAGLACLLGGFNLGRHF